MSKQYFSLGICSLAVLLLLPSAFAQTASFSLSFSPNSSSVAQGGRTNASMNITGTTTDFYPVIFAISQGLPAGLSVEFSPGSCPPPCNSIMTVIADPTAPTGTYVIPVIGAALGQTMATSYTVTIVALPKFDYSISLTSSQGSTATGEGVNTTLNLDQLSGTSNFVNLSASGQPSGVTVNFDTYSCAPPCSALISFDVSTLTSGVYPITISATAGSITKKVIYSLQIVPSSLSDFSLSMFPQSNIISKNESVNALVTLTRLFGTSRDVTLTIANQPASTTVQLSQSSCQPPCSAILSISTENDIKAGSYQIIVLGYSGGITKNIIYNLIVKESSNPVGIVTGSFFSRPLFRGLRGNDVLRLQQYLARDPSLYPEGITTGFYGGLTEKAVGRFQVKYSIVPGVGAPGWGRFGPRTLAKLNAILTQ